MADTEMATLTESMAADAAFLLDHQLGVFERALRQRRGLVPCAAAVATTGEIMTVAVEAGEGTQAPELIELLSAMLTESRAEWRAAYVAYPVADANNDDLIELHCDFSEGATGLVAAIPYESGGLWREPSVGVASWQLLPKFIWVAQVT